MNFQNRSAKIPRPVCPKYVGETLENESVQIMKERFYKNKMDFRGGGWICDSDTNCEDKTSLKDCSLIEFGNSNDSLLPFYYKEV